ncbi:MAG: sigma 54-interacting transcriptional regulator [Myxococcales bacterium]|nr:sigma 54-interacting transcriptional regulator [Myxococcales bacterium]
MSHPTETQTDILSDLPGSPPGEVGLVTIFSELPASPRPPSLKREQILGRDESVASWVIDDSKVSRRHAALRVTADRVAIADLESRNGVYLDGERLQGERLVPPGVVVRIGRSLFLSSADVGRYTGFPPPVLVGPLIGGPSLDPLRRTVRHVAPSMLSVLIEGETGTGKELAASMVHRASARVGPLVAVNCAAIPRELVESELFGHADGAFSGSRGAREGLFRRADGGTLFLDEVGELSLDVQAKLLRVLEELKVRPVGSDEARTVDVRIVAATHRDLESMVDAGTFREDLMHRLTPVVLKLPPLRERREDIPLIAGHFAREHGVTVAVGAMEALCLGEQRGNVRALRSHVQRAAVTARGEGRSRILPEDVPRPSPKATASMPPAGDAQDARDLELRARLDTALTINRGNVAKVGRDLSISRSSLYELLKRFAIDPKTYR